VLARVANVFAAPLVAGATRSRTIAGAKGYDRGRFFFREPLPPGAFEER